jgi:hypothetical protein
MLKHGSIMKYLDRWAEILRFTQDDKTKLSD